MEKKLLKLYKLEKGTKLMWDASPATYPNTNEPIIYPATVGEKHHTNKWAMIYTGHTRNWIGEVEHLRYPTDEELKTLQWPEPR